ncbi:MAG: ATP phosphoribosyltransferase [Nitrospiria bacterium]
MGEPLVIAVSKGRLLAFAVDFFEKMGIVAGRQLQESRRLMFDAPEKDVRLLLVRAVDVPTYVEYGAADIGLAGKDLLLEQMCDVYEPLDLGFGHCRIVLAEAENGGYSQNPKRYTKRRVATKYPNITEQYFSEKGIPIEIIKLYGSIELAPLVGLADQIVDLTSTGATLKANHLKIVDEIAECSARVIVNRASLKLKYPVIQDILAKMKGILLTKQEKAEEAPC